MIWRWGFVHDIRACGSTPSFVKGITLFGTLWQPSRTNLPAPIECEGLSGRCRLSLTKGLLTSPTCWNAAQSRETIPQSDPTENGTHPPNLKDIRVPGDPSCTCVFSGGTSASATHRSDQSLHCQQEKSLANAPSEHVF
jgi:hypothetical protein